MAHIFCQCIIYIDRATFKSDPNLETQITRLSSTVIVAMPTSSVPLECRNEYRATVGFYSIMCSRLGWDAIVSRMSWPGNIAFIARHTGHEFDTETIIQLNRHKFQAPPAAIAKILGDLKTPETAAEGEPA